MAGELVQTEQSQLPDQIMDSSASGQPSAGPQPVQPNQPANTQPIDQNQKPIQVIAASPRASIFHAILNTLGGGDKTQYTVDPQSGTMREIRVPQSSGGLAKSIVAGALTGLFAGAGERGPGSELRAFQAGGQAAMQQHQVTDAKQRMQAQQDYENQQKQLVQKAQIFEANTRSALNIQQVEKLGDERMDEYLSTLHPLVEKAEEENRIIAGQDQPITQAEAKSGMKDGKYNPAEDQFVATARVPRINPDGTQGTGSELVGVIIKDGPFAINDHPDFPADKAREYGFLPARTAGPGTVMKTSIANQVAQKVAMVDNARTEMEQVHDKLGTAADSMPNFDDAIKTPGMAKALARFQSYIGAAKGFDPAVAINLMSKEKQDPKTGKMMQNPDAQYVPLVYKAFGGQDVIEKYEKTIAPEKAEMTKAKAEDILSRDPKTVAPDQLAQAKRFMDNEAASDAEKIRRDETIRKQVEKDVSQKDIEQAAKNIVSGDVISTMRDISSYKTNERARLANAIVKEAKQAGKDPRQFDAAHLEGMSKVITDFSSGKSADEIRSFNTFAGHLAEAADANQDWRRANSPLINKPISWLAVNAKNDPNYVRYETSILPGAKEYMSFLNQNRAEHESDIKQMDKILDPNRSPAQMEEAFKELAKTADIRLAQLGRKYSNTIHRPYENIVSPEGAQAFQKLGVKSTALQLQGGQSEQAPQVPAGARPVIVNGQTVGYTTDGKTMTRF